MHLPAIIYPSTHLMALNLVEMAKSQLSGNVLGQLSSLIGESPEKTTSATGATLPAILAAVTNLGSKPEGATQLLSTLRNVDPSIVDKFSSLLGSQGTNVAQQGNSLLGGLFGGSMIAGLAGVVAKFTGLRQETATTLIGTLAPMVLGVLSKHTQAQGLNVSSLAGLLAGQKKNVEAALPPGMAPLLSNVPGLQGFLGPTGDAARSAADTSRAAVSSAGQAARDTATETRSKMPGWLVPLAVLVVLALLLFQFLKPRPAPPAANEAPTATETPAATAAATETPAATAAPAGATANFTGQLTGVLTGVTQTLSGVHDADSAKAAVPQIKDASSKLDSLKTVWAQLPDSAKTEVRTSVTPKITAVQDLVTKVEAMPGVGDILKPAADDLVSKLKDLLG